MERSVQIIHPEKSWQRTAELLMSGEQPFDISSTQNIDLKLVYDNIRMAISREHLSRVDVWFHLDLNHPRYAKMYEVVRDPGRNTKDEVFKTYLAQHHIKHFYSDFGLNDKTMATVELEFFVHMRNCISDYYELLSRIEVDLHDIILLRFAQFKGRDWWRTAIH